MRKLQVIKWVDAKEFEEHVNKFVSAHKIINTTYAIRQGHAGSFVAFIEYEETDDTEPEGKKIKELEEEENAELKKVAEFQQSSDMSRYFENKKFKEVLAVGSTFNKALNSMNKSLEEERDKYRNMVFDKNEQLTKAKEIIKQFLYLFCYGQKELPSKLQIEAERFLNGEVKKWLKNLNADKR